MFLLKIGARRQIKYKFGTGAFIDNLNVLTDSALERIAHPDTLAYLLMRLPPDEVSAVIGKMVNRLIRMKCLQQDRLLGQYYMIAVDGTGYINFGHMRHCARCLSMTMNDKTIYYHPVLEAKLITTRGMAVSVETEFIEKQDGVTEEDCELRAFYRLAEKLKKRFPQLRICLSLDSLYANQQVFDICRKNDWKYVITFKKGSMSAVYEEAMAIKSLQRENRGIDETGDIRQEYSWAADIEYETHKLQVLECREFKRGYKKAKRYMWLTNIGITHGNFNEIGNNGGRLRWKIENEGFNMQKRGGYKLEHIYSSHATALKNFYYLLQIAHLISQLMEKGSLLRDRIKKVLGGVRNFTYRLLEDLRTKCITPEIYRSIVSGSFQIRIDSS